MTSRRSRFREKAVAGIAALVTGALILALTAAVPACAAKRNDEAQILELVERLRDHAEKREAAAIMKLIHEDYEDFQGRNRERAKTFIEDHFRRYRGIVIHLLKTEIDGETGMDERFVEADVHFSSGVAEKLRRAIRFAGETYRIELTVVRNAGDEWRLLGASWRPVASEDLLPGSREMLDELLSEALRNIF
jgi:hypothetical protein